VPDFSRRSRETEWLDEAELHADELADVLRDLARFNGAMFGRRTVLNWLRRALRDAPQSEPLTLLDVGCGYGDLLRAISHWARQHDLPLHLVGVDLSKETVRIAQSATNARDGIEYHAVDIFDFQPDRPIDFVISSLLAHHFGDALIVAFLRWMEMTARKGWFIYDLQRHPVPYHFIGLMRLVTQLHPMVIHDGRISVSRSLTRAEWEDRIADAGIPRHKVTLRWFLYRFAIGRLQ